MNAISPANESRPATPHWILLGVIAVAGLFYVKWQPYWDKAFLAAGSHSIGASILTGKAAAPPAPSWNAALAYGLSYGKAIWKALVLGLLLGSGVQALIPTRWVARRLGGRGFASAFLGGVVSLPGMMCSCCAAPVVVGLRRQRASSGGAVAFWLGNSVLNPATLVFMGFVLGWGWTALRLGLGLLMVFGLGYLANRVEPEGAETTQAVVAASRRDPFADRPPLVRWLLILGRMTLQLVPEYIVLVLLLGAARAWLFPVLGPTVGDSLVWIVLFAVAGALFVIPTAGEVPIVQAMLALGVGAGPAGALLMTLAPISLPSAAMVWRSLPPRVLGLVCVGVVLIGIAGGGLAVALGLGPRLA